MLTITDALKIFFENVSNKNIIGIGEWNDKYIFGTRDKNLKEDEPDYDSTVEMIDKKTGEFSTMSWFDSIDLFKNTKELLNEEQVKELISSLTFDK